MIELLPFADTDFEKLISWVESEEAMFQFAGSIFSFPLTQNQLQIYLEDDNRFVYKVVLSSTNMTIGHGEIYLEKNTAVLCRIIIGEQAYRGFGIGLRIVNKLLKIAFIQCKAERAELNVFNWNTAAIRCYQKAGFLVNPQKTKERELKGKIWTVLNMSLDKSDWKLSTL